MSDENLPNIPPPSVPGYTPPPPSPPHAVPDPVPYTPPVEPGPPVVDPYAAPSEAPPVSSGLPDSPVYGAGKLSESDDKTFCILSHILGLVFGFIPPLLFWLLKKDESPAVEAHAKEALNFQITLLIAYFVSTVILCGHSSFLVIVPMLYGWIMCIIAATKASEGILYRYPITLRLIK
jgi:uncharacterized protein